MAINPNKWLRIHTKMAELGIQEEDLEEQFVQGSGPGGQKINKTASCVILKYPHAKIVIRCQRARSRELNRYDARKELCERVEKQIREKALKKKAAASKERRINRKPTKTEKAKLVKSKRSVSKKKTLRKTPKADD